LQQSTEPGFSDAVPDMAHRANAVRTTTRDASTLPSAIFVTGASRSGTTMLARIFGGHSRVCTLHETHYFGDLCDPDDAEAARDISTLTKLGAAILARHERGLWSGDPRPSELDRARAAATGLPEGERNAAGIFAAVTRALAGSAGKVLPCEQTPRNVFYARRLLALYPDVRIIHIVRDPRAVLASQKNRWRMKGLGASHLPSWEMLRNRVNYHPITISKLWIAANREALALENASRFRLVRFEDLVAEPESTVRSLCEFAGLDFEADMLDLPQWGSSNLSHASDKRGISSDVVDQWSRVLTDAEIIVCERLTRAMMHRFAYEPMSPAPRSFAGIGLVLGSYPVHLAAVIAVNPSRAWIQAKALYRRRLANPSGDPA
jgi:hypothetical protein